MDGSRLSTAMNSKATYRNRVELLQGTLDMLILQSLQWGPQHGYALSQAIRLKSSEALQVETGSLYPALHRLERQGWVSSEWRLTESKQRARFYAITPTGKVQLADDHSRWRQMVEAIDAIMQDKSSEA
jgi:PadR family transcriptional regulator PadR